MNITLLLDAMYRPLSLPAGLLILGFGLVLFLRGRRMIRDLNRDGKADSHAKFLRSWGVVGMLAGAVLLIPLPQQTAPASTHDRVEAYTQGTLSKPEEVKGNDMDAPGGDRGTDATGSGTGQSSEYNQNKQVPDPNEDGTSNKVGQPGNAGDNQ